MITVAFTNSAWRAAGSAGEAGEEIGEAAAGEVGGEVGETARRRRASDLQVSLRMLAGQ